MAVGGSKRAHIRKMCGYIQCVSHYSHLQRDIKSEKREGKIKVIESACSALVGFLVSMIYDILGHLYTALHDFADLFSAFLWNVIKMSRDIQIPPHLIVKRFQSWRNSNNSMKIWLKLLGTKWEWRIAQQKLKRQIFCVLEDPNGSRII
ncbi:hypothetical protein SUGI_0572510 [Cryptomeria japonica]|nr:hypothetical protein SUGI_0572510 [Cryptomeria japonica]